MTFGILSYGAYVPRLRLQRKVIADANSWFNAALKGLGKGERAMANWDEDPVTMAVEAARDALVGHDRAGVTAVTLASTTFPFLDRLNAGVVTGALNLDESTASNDISGTQRAGTTALLQALNSRGQTLVAAAEKRDSNAASPLEMQTGDGAAALLIGEGEPVAKLLASATRSADFVDHFRTIDSGTDYGWEERWVRDAGYMTIVPPAIKAALDKAGLTPADVNHFVMPAVLPKLANAMAKKAGVADAAVRDNLSAVCGDTGAAHALVMLVHALEQAKAGERILVVGFGQGVDVMVFEVTAANEKRRGGLGVSGHLARRREETNYNKFLAFNDVVEIERGMRSEADKLTALSAMWRNRGAVTSFTGGKCEKCGTLQYPISRICVNPNCGAVDTQKPEPFADKTGRVNSYTADRLTYSPDPPACYGMIQFEEGGRWMMDFTDVDEKDLEVGRNMRMMFRVKDIDNQRGFRRYFWKAAPVAAGGN